jgi:hypothetical protein
MPSAPQCKKRSAGLVHVRQHRPRRQDDRDTMPVVAERRDFSGRLKKGALVLPGAIYAEFRLEAVLLLRWRL